MTQPLNHQEQIVVLWEQQLDAQVRAMCALADNCMRLFQNDMKLKRFVQFHSTRKKTLKLSQALYVHMLKRVGFMPSQIAIALRRDRAIVRQLDALGIDVFKSLKLDSQNELLELVETVHEAKKVSMVKPESLHRHMFKQLQALEMQLRDARKVRSKNNSETASHDATKQTREADTRQPLMESETH